MFQIKVVDISEIDILIYVTVAFTVARFGGKLIISIWASCWYCFELKLNSPNYFWLRYPIVEINLVVSKMKHADWQIDTRALCCALIVCTWFKKLVMRINADSDAARPTRHPPTGGWLHAVVNTGPQVGFVCKPACLRLLSCFCHAIERPVPGSFKCHVVVDSSASYMSSIQPWKPHGRKVRPWEVP
jgi:hypothetical protein